MSPASRHLRHGARCLGEGLLAAGLGLALVGLAVLLLWITAPYPDDGAWAATRLAADLWLLAHGAALVRHDTLGGQPAPIGLAPMLLSALPCWLLWRAVRVVPGGPGPAAALWISAGYLLAGAAAAVHASGAPFAPEPRSVALHLPPAVLGVTLAAAAAWVWPTGMAAHAARTALATAAALCGAGALLATGALVLRAEAAREAFGPLGGSWPGSLAIALLCLSLMPNAAVWGAAYGLGPGFAAGTAGGLGPLADGGPAPELPAFPLLSALPAGPPQGPLPWAAVAAVPLAGAVVTARLAAAPRRAGWGATTLTALLAAVGTGAALGVLAALAGGPLGTGQLAAFGPDPWAVALAATGWTALLGTPLALTLHAWRLRRRPLRRATGRAGVGPGDDWHLPGAREARWAAMRRVCGTLIPDFPATPLHPPPRPSPIDPPDAGPGP